MSSLEFEGKNIDNAVQIACDELNLTKDELQYKVLSRGSSGIFGLAGAKKARIKVYLPDKTSEREPDEVAVTPPESVFEEPAQGAGSVPAEDSTAHRPHPPDSGENPLELSREVLQRIVDAITSDATITTEETNGRILLNVNGGNAGALIGKKGQTLEAIQSLVDKIVNKHHRNQDRIRVRVDVEGYLETRKLNLEKLAQRLADKSKRIRKPISLGQMNGYDRRIVHLALRDDPEVKTKSRGEGQMRKLVIFPQKNSAHRQASQ